METSMTNGQPLLGTVALQPADETKSGKLLSIDLDLLDDNPYQPRSERDEGKLAELCESIVHDGQLQPILVRPMGERWQVIFGHGRVEALRRLRREARTPEERARFSKVRAEERTDVPDDQMLLLALVENVQREDLSPVDCAAALDRLRSMHPELKTIRQLAAAVHIEPPRVKRLLRLHGAPVVIKDAVSKGRSVLVQGVAESEDEMEGGDQADPSDPAAVSTRETRRLDLCSALELAKLHAVWTMQHVGERAATEPTPDERISELINRALRQSWTLRRIQAEVVRLTTDCEDSGADERARSAESSAFKANAKKILIFPKRLDQMSESQKAELKTVLAPIWNRLFGSSLEVPRPDEPLFPVRNWVLGLKAWAQVVHSFRQLVKLLQRPVDPPPKSLPAGAPAASPQPSPAPVAAALPPPSATPSPPVGNDPNPSNASKAA